MADTRQENQTSLTQFILLGFGTLPKLQPLLFLLFLVIYLVTMAGNLLIVVLVVADWHLHTPMYFFLGNLSCLEICYSSSILPRLLAGLLMGDRTISVDGCITQFFFSGFFVATECYLLAVMSYDRYLAICKPLHYATRMCGDFCLQLAAGSWINGILAVTIIVSLMSQLTFCGPDEIDHFFCEATQLINHFCKDMYHLDLVINIVTALLTLPPFVLTVTSYVCIISTVLRIPSTTGRQKAFSTCSSHLTVVTIFYGILMVVYLLPKSNMLRDLDKVFSICYTFLTPLANPLIYSLRNTEVKGALRKLVRKCAGFSRIQ
ncbi:olfactory receptor 1f45-like [Pelodiscus sinensis]|uniref:olfactory receptor 1f45-like n=1 Tax=Pelodiscus sinensis TaxID=13735 RepID=UPI0003C4B865|nr:olfactory receptor 1361-like [Pelodiscus sinensis]|eukprot:XP_006129619.1 olfactory receptor 1361-like [Pelodiscus sinensis]